MSKRFPYGNINLKGKKEKMLSCGCCVATNRRECTKEKEDIKEMREAMKTKPKF